MYLYKSYANLFQTNFILGEIIIVELPIVKKQ